LIVEIHLQLRADSWPHAYAQLLEVLREDQTQYSIVPLYITYDIEDTEVRICFQVEEPAKLEQFVVNKIRPIDGVHGTRARLTLNGEIFPSGVAVLAEGSSSLRSSHVFLKVDPKKDACVWNGLLRLQENGGVSPIWVFRDFYEYDRDITLRLIGKTDKAIREYVEQQIGPIEGVLIWRLQFMGGMTQILAKEKLLALAKHWMRCK